MGDTPSGVVAWRTCPSGVASFGRVTHAPADPRALYRAILRSLLHLSGAAPGSPKVGSRMVLVVGGAAVGPRFVEQIIDHDGVTVLKTVEVPQCRFVWVRPVLGQGR